MPPRLPQRVAVIILISASAALCAQEPAGRAEARERLLEIKAEIEILQNALARDRTAHAAEQRSIRALDLEIQDNAKKVRDLEQQVSGQQDELQRLRRQRDQTLKRLGSRRRQLEAQILAAWKMGRQSRLKLVLNQDSPARASRLLAYYEYFNRAQVAQITELRSTLAGLDEIGKAIAAELAALEQALNRQRDAERTLQGQRSERLALMQELQANIGSGETRLVELERNRADLEALLERLADALADIPADLGEHDHPGARKGRLPMPIPGRVLHAFGQPRGAGLEWQGWLVEAQAGAEIRAIAYGRVAYADWLRGYGLLIIIDHGQGFMSLYGHNESLLFSVGDWVQPGAVIATVGRNPGPGQGAYFELRNGGKAVDPAVWVTRR